MQKMDEHEGYLYACTSASYIILGKLPVRLHRRQIESNRTGRDVHNRTFLCEKRIAKNYYKGGSQQ